MAIIFWRISNWKPSFVFSIKSFKYFTSYSLKLLGADLINVFYQNIIIFIIGKLYGSSSLGFYTRAKAFGDTSSLHASQIIQGVSFPVLSNLKSTTETFKNAVIKFFRLSAFITFPVTMGLFVLSKEVVIVLLTSKWLPTVPLIQVICLVGFFYPLTLISQNVINVLGNSKLYLRIEVFKIALVILNIFITYSYGLKIMILGQAIAIFITYLVYTFFLKRLIDYGLWSQIKSISLIFLLSLTMALIIWFCKSFFYNDIVKLVFGLFIGCGLYF
jgi:O-antigen/teichoic acid export membrane protein